MIGFVDAGVSAKNSNCLKSVVKVEFYDKDLELSYYNDRFALKVGDVVYVEGKLAGVLGCVTEVTTHFKISLDVYKRVIAKLDLTMHGCYRRIGPMMVCFEKEAVPFKQFQSWVCPPTTTKKEFIYGEGYEVDPSTLQNYDFIDDKIFWRGVDYFSDGKVGFLSLRGNEGHAMVKGSVWYQVDFKYEDGIVKELFCDCSYPGFCKHEVCLCLTLDSLLKEFKEKDENDDVKNESFVAINAGIFYRIVMFHAEGVKL